MPNYLRLICAAVVALIVVEFPANAKGSQRFEGKLIVEPLSDGRNLRIVRSFSYIDPKGTRWSVPAGIITDGASVPRAAWILFPPFTGKHRIAAVVHDHYCQTRSRSWQRVHRAFYDAMITAGVDVPSAKTMFAAVWLFGPRWLADGSRTRSAEEALPAEEQRKQIRQLQDWIGRTTPSTGQIEAVLNKVRN